MILQPTVRVRHNAAPRNRNRFHYSGDMPETDRRAARTQEILAATRRLFDERGVRDAQIEDIARAVGINRAIIYRHFSGKEELFAMTLVSYLDELHDALQAVDDPSAAAAERVERLGGAVVG